MMKNGILSLVVFIFVATAAQAFADSYIRVKPAYNQPPEAEVYEGEIAPFARFLMKPVNPSCSVMLQNLTVQVDSLNQLYQAVDKVVLILEKSKGVDRVNEGRVVAEGSSRWGDYVSLYPIHGDNIIAFRNRIKATVSIVMNDNLDDFSGDLSLFVTNIRATWTNGSTVKIKGYIPIICATKAISSESGAGIVNELDSLYGTLKYEVPEDSSEVWFSVRFSFTERKKA